MNNKYISTEAFGKVLKIFCANIFVVYFQYIYIYKHIYIYIYKYNIYKRKRRSEAYYGLTHPSANPLQDTANFSKFSTPIQ